MGEQLRAFPYALQYNDTAVMIFEGFQECPHLGSHDTERRKFLKRIIVCMTAKDKFPNISRFSGLKNIRIFLSDIFL